MLLRYLPSGRRRRLLALAVVVVAVGALLTYLATSLERQREVEELRLMRDSLAALRASVDTCRSGLARQEASFRRFDAGVDSLRERIEAYEGMHPSGVPSEEYQSYLETFDRYNDSVGGWQARADSLRATEARCRVAVERHNAFADSLRSRLRAREAEGVD